MVAFIQSRLRTLHSNLHDLRGHLSEMYSTLLEFDRVDTNRADYHEVIKSKRLLEEKFRSLKATVEFHEEDMRDVEAKFEQVLAMGTVDGEVGLSIHCVIDVLLMMCCCA